MTLKFSLNKYLPLPTEDDDNDLPPYVAEQGRNRLSRRKQLAFYLVAVVVVICSLLSLPRFVRFAGGCMRTCQGIQRNKSTLARLPSHYILPSGDKIPSVALGVWKAGKSEVGNAVKTAIKAGYRHIDGAWIYGNEAEVGQAIRESTINREDLFITSKLWNTFHAPEDIEPALDQSLERLGIEYLDLYLIHWPIAFTKDGNSVLDEELTADPYPTWKKLEEMVDKGKVRNIGISNFNIRRVQNLTSNPLKYKPAVNQVELNFWNPQSELLEWAKENDLLLEAYSPLGSSKQVGRTLSLPEVKEISCQLGITPAQVIISWHVQRGTIVLPKSVTASRIIENYQVFELPREDFDKVEAAAKAHPPQRVVNPSEQWGLPFDVFDE